ncbi:CBS domain-containing protein [Albirhodobacter sp. R86504]|jgi:CBS domain-containing protein|uniref:CBS domain-containing protein n=1 Tax=Albirhodobacter sp. R86504 TaxID=3093848 RepID=UPI003672F119
MQVQHILKEKSEDGVVTVVPGTLVSAVAQLLSERKIGAVIVSKDGKHAEGIVSERDIVRELGKRGPASLNDAVDDIMTRKLVSCTRGDTALEVLGKMSTGRFRHMPVIEDGEMIGLISIGDAVQARLKELAMEKDALTGMIMGN